MDHKIKYKSSVTKHKHSDNDYEYSNSQSYKGQVESQKGKAKIQNEKVKSYTEKAQSEKVHKHSNIDYLDNKNYKHSDKVYKHSEKGFIFDDKLIEEVVLKYSDMVYRIALNILCNREDANDVMQDVFLRLVRSKSKIKSKEHIKHWLIKVSINCSKSKATESYKKNTVSISEISESSISCTNEIDETISSVMKLPEKYKVPIHLYYYQQLTVDEISKALGITKSGVRSRLSRGRNMLKEILEKEDNNE